MWSVRSPFLVSSIVLVALVGSVSPAAAALNTTDTVYLDSYDPANDGDAGPASTSDLLEPGRVYLAVVSGTFSVVNPDVWGFFPGKGECGTPESSPMTPSPGVADSPVGQDAELRFALPWQRFCPGLPKLGGGFQIDVGGGFNHPDPIGGRPAQVAPGHRYSYSLTGQGQPARFRIVAQPTGDDDGILSIVVHPADGGTPEATPAAPAATDAPTVGLPATTSCLRSRRIKLHLRARE